MPAVDPDYVMPDWWLMLSREEKRTAPRPELILRPRRIRPASEAKPGFSFDDVGPYLKLPDGTVLRDRKTARQRLWRHLKRAPGYRQVVDWLPARGGGRGRPIRGRTAERVLDALVCFSLVRAGMTQIRAAQTVVEWADQGGRDPKKVADDNRAIWREHRLPPVSE